MSPLAHSGEGAGPRISVVIVAYHSQAVLADCVRSVRNAIPGSEVLVVDNAEDPCAEGRAGLPSDVVFIEGQGNVGFGSGCNLGARRATGDVLFFLNPDTRIAEIDRAALDRDLSAVPFGLLAPLLTDANGLDPRHAVYRFRGLLPDFLKHTFGPVLPRGVARRLGPRRAAADGWVSGAAFMVSKPEFLASGGFDERFFLYYEDQDLSRRYLESGLPLRRCVSALVRHTSGSSTVADDASAVTLTSAWLSWLQYVAVWHGERAAARVAASGSALRRLVRRTALLAAPTKGGSGKLRGKAELLVRGRELEEEWVRPESTGPFSSSAYPDARRALLGGAAGEGPGPALEARCSPSPPTTRRAPIFGVHLDLDTFDEAVDHCRSLIAQRRPVQHVVLNAGKVVMMQDQPALVAAVRRCDIVHADGQSVVWAGRLAGLNVPERVAGIDLMLSLLGVCEDEAWPVYFLGARREVLDAFVSVVRERFPELEIAGYQDGYFTDDAKVAHEVGESGARVLFVAISSPRKELFLSDWLSTMGPIFAMGVGGSFDVVAGTTKRAPVWMQRSGLEWFYRFSQEPQRLWKRYLVGNARFMALAARETYRQRHSYHDDNDGSDGWEGTS